MEVEEVSRHVRKQIKQTITQSINRYVIVAKESAKTMAIAKPSAIVVATAAAREAAAIVVVAVVAVVAVVVVVVVVVVLVES